jgi:hypothetical protein
MARVLTIIVLLVACICGCSKEKPQESKSAQSKPWLSKADMEKFVKEGHITLYDVPPFDDDEASRLRAQESEAFNESAEVKELWARRELPHTTPDGRTPAQLQAEYGPALSRSDAEVAAKVLQAIWEIIEREDGLFDKTLGDLAIAALRIKEDPKFMRLLLYSVPLESRVKFFKWGVECQDAGESERVLTSLRPFNEYPEQKR